MLLFNENVLENELEERINLNFQRLSGGKEYSIEKLFREPGYGWQGDFEGRALLAFVSQHKLGHTTDRMDIMLSLIEEKTDGKLFFGLPTKDAAAIDEQQLSGHSWYLRGLCEHYELFGDRLSLDAAHETFRQLYLPISGKISTYPTTSRTIDGGVSGSSSTVQNGWLLSTDVGCIVMSLDGLSHYYKLTNDARAKAICDELAALLETTDIEKLKMQTHCTLTAGRGLMRLWGMTHDRRYIALAEKIMRLYVRSGMTYIYQNYNWWGRRDTWTEPCAIVDSLMLSGELYSATENPDYKRLSARIWHNGFSSLQRSNGGAGTDVTVDSERPVLSSKMWEAWFCCSMRLAEGLYYADTHRELLEPEIYGKPHKDPLGRWMDGDIIYASMPEKYRTDPVDTPDGVLSPLAKYYKIPKAEAEALEQRVVFN